MKVLIVGSQKVWAIENTYQKCLIELGVDVELYPIHDHFFDFYYSRLINKLIYRINPGHIFNKLNKELKIKVQQSKPDVVWIFKGMEVYPQTLKYLKKIGAKLVNFNPDHPFLFSGKGSGNKNVFDSIGLYDLHFCYHQQVMKIIEEEYNVPCTYLPFGYEPVDVQLPSEQEEIKRACFIGNPDKKRAQHLQYLIDNKVPLDVYGNAWHKWLKPSSNTNIFPAFYGDDFNNIAPLYRVQINIFRDHNEGSHNMRTFEMPGLSCIMLAPDSIDHRSFFIDGKEVFYYRDINDLLKKCKYCLELDFQSANGIRNASLHRSKEGGYDYMSRSKEVLKLMKDII